jgi:hypothetical protein
MILAILLLLSGLTISGVAIYYSVMGLMAIFSAAAIPIAIMGVSLEIGKLVTASWVKAHWQRLPVLMKSYAVGAVAILMLITSLGIFGFLSKAHSDQTLVSGDVQAKVAIYDERIKTEKDNIEADRKQIAQMDAAVDQVLSRSDDEKGASKANEIRRSQLRDRSRLQNEILASQKKIATIQDERAPFAAENRKVEAEVGPIKYIAAFVYGANPDANILERAVTWVIILIVIVFDPLAVVMLLASQMTFAWIKEEKQAKYEQDEGPLTVDQIEQIKSREVPELTPEQTELHRETFPIPEPTIGTSIVEEKVEDVEEKPADVTTPEKVDYEFVEEHSGEDEVPEIKYIVTNSNPADNVPIISDKKDIIQDIVSLVKRNSESTDIEKSVFEKEDTPNYEGVKDFSTGEWVQTGPAFNVKKTEKVDTIDTKTEFTHISDEYVMYQGKRMHRRALAEMRPDLKITVDNPTEPNIDFGHNFPTNVRLGDMFTRVDIIPHRTFKFNGQKWIEVKRDSTETHLTEDYVKHLIEKLSTGEYNPEFLTSNEQDAITQLFEKSPK